MNMLTQFLILAGCGAVLYFGGKAAANAPPPRSEGLPEILPNEYTPLYLTINRGPIPPAPVAPSLTNPGLAHLNVQL